MTQNSNGYLLANDERAVLEEVCSDIGVLPEIVERMIAAENRVYGMGRRHGIWEALRALVDEGVARLSLEAGQ